MAKRSGEFLGPTGRGGPSGLQRGSGPAPLPAGATREGTEAASPARDPRKKALPGRAGAARPCCPQRRSAGGGSGSARSDPQRQPAPPAAHPPPLPASFLPILRSFLLRRWKQPPAGGRGCPPLLSLPPAATGEGGCDAAGGSPGVERGLPFRRLPGSPRSAPAAPAAAAEGWQPGAGGPRGGQCRGGGSVPVSPTPWMTRQSGLGERGAGARLFAGCIQWATP